MLSSSPVITSSPHGITALCYLHAADRCWNIPAAPCRRTPDRQRFICMEQLRSCHDPGHSSAILLTSGSTVPWAPALLHSDCQPHPSHQGNSRNLLSVSLALHTFAARLSGATFYTGFQLTTLPESQSFPQPSVLCLPSTCSFDCDKISCLVAVFFFASPCRSLLSRHSLFCHTGFSMCAVWVFHLLTLSSTFPCVCCKLH